MGSHPSVFNFVDKLKIEQHEQEINMTQIEAAADPEARRKEYTKNDLRILKIIKKYDEEIEDDKYLPFLKAIAANNNGGSTHNS